MLSSFCLCSTSIKYIKRKALQGKVFFYINLTDIKILSHKNSVGANIWFYMDKKTKAILHKYCNNIM